MTVRALRTGIGTIMDSLRTLAGALASAVALLAQLAAPAVAQDNPARFRPIDVYVDSSERPLAAYQVEIIADNATIAGVEGGEDGAFNEPPYYDPKALTGGRIILAAFDTGEDLPSGRTRVATLHMLEARDASYEVHLMAAGNDAGERIAAEAFVEPRE